jgi:molecular chaperone HscC
MIGIDLGTTNSLVATLDEGRPITLHDELGNDLIPSVVAIAEDGAILVGRAAKDRLTVAPESGVACFKRDMGTGAKYRFGGRMWTPVECSALVLRELKRIGELRLEKEIHSAVITVPAYFHDQQRQATVEAAKIAGLKVDRLLNEPTAAALAYGYKPETEMNTLLVFDLGGGTFDVTVLESFDGVVEVKASAGESRLGGEDYTDALAAWIQKEFHWQPSSQDVRRWREKVEMLKRELTLSEKAVFSINGKDAPISRADFRAATAELSVRLRPVVRRALRDANLTPKHLDAVLLVGGASRMPVVIDQVREDLGLPPNAEMDPDRVVALGAALQQGLCMGDAAVSDLVLTDVCPHSLGVEISKTLVPGVQEPGYFSVILDRNTTVPTSRSGNYHTLHPDQDEVTLNIFQGEGRLTKDNHRVGKVKVTGLRTRPGQKFPGQMDVRFSYDMNGILEVEVTILETGRKLTEVFEQRPGTMTPAQIAEAIRALGPLKIHPRELPPNRARLERANRLFADLSGGMREQLSFYVDRFEAALHLQDSAKIKEAGAELDSMMKPFFKDEE